MPVEPTLANAGVPQRIRSVIEKTEPGFSSDKEQAKEKLENKVVAQKNALPVGGTGTLTNTINKPKRQRCANREEEQKSYELELFFPIARLNPSRVPGLASKEAERSAI